jgi:type III restriction enzyme
MEFRFNATQEYQLHAIEAVADLFKGQPFIPSELVTPERASFTAIANRLDLMDEDLLANLNRVQSNQGLPLDTALKFIEEDIETVSGSKTARFCNFSVEMETGTGKTYVYIRTILELFRRYGLRKHIVVVPSVAVREGVFKTLQMTEKHFSEQYDNIPYRYYIYDSAHLSQVRQFSLSGSIEIMVMTIDAFNKAANIIRQHTDDLQGEKPMHLVQAVRPILILDEPQNMESERSIAAMAMLDPLVALRYSATHRNPYNLIYRLTPYEAYREGLVKRIEVASVQEEDNANLPFIRVDEITTAKHTLRAKVAIHKLMVDGTIKERVITVKPEDSLVQRSGRPEYEGFEVAEISYGGGFVRFANHVEVHKGEAVGSEKEAIFEA